VHIKNYYKTSQKITMNLNIGNSSDTDRDQPEMASPSQNSPTISGASASTSNVNKSANTESTSQVTNQEHTFCERLFSIQNAPSSVRINNILNYKFRS
jgi:hypothetical protein